MCLEPVREQITQTEQRYDEINIALDAVETQWRERSRTTSVEC
jgi:hypothetical protein